MRIEPGEVALDEDLQGGVDAIGRHHALELPNGNTLICEGSFGRLFEVTREGEVVWEYVNPYFGRSANTPESPETNNTRSRHAVVVSRSAVGLGVPPGKEAAST